MSSNADSLSRFQKRSDRELEAIVARCERALLRGTSSHADFDALIVAERELLRRSGVRLRTSTADDVYRSQLRNRSGEEDTLVF